jgi:BON domain-containing protein
VFRHFPELIMKRPSQHVYVYVFVIVLTFAASCARRPDDAKISSDIQNKFSQDSGLASKQLTVQADNGTVTLAGIVDNDAQRQAASRQAASIPGVKQVVNNLQVGNEKPAAAVPEPAETEASSAPPPSPVRAERNAPRKSHKARASEDSGAAGNSANDAGSHQTSADNQPHADAAPPVPPANTAVQNAPPPPPPPRKLIIDQGTQLAIRLVDPIDSEKNQTGDVFHATINAAITSDGELAVPTGADVTGHLVDVKSAGKFKGQSVVVLQLDSLSVGGRTYTLQTDQYRKEGSSRGKNTAEKVGGGAIIGGIIGAIAGGGKGAAIGTAAGAGVGAGAQEVSKSQQIKLPSETVLNFTLQAPITVVQAPNPNANRPRLGDSQ